MALAFDTCWDRVARAEVHRQSLIQKWNGLETNDVYTSDAKVDDNGTGKFFIHTIKRDWLLPFSLQFGEMLYQLRSALDSCVYDAAVLEFKRYPPPDEEHWNFPICATAAKFKEATRRMKKLTGDMRRLLEAVQPYSGATGKAEGMEWDLGQTVNILNEWARIDRHRKLHLVGTAVSEGNLGFRLPRGMRVESCDFQVGECLIEHDTEIARFRISNYIPGTKVYVNAKFAFEIVVDEVPRMTRLQDAALAMGWSVSGIRESFEKHYGVTR